MSESYPAPSFARAALMGRCPRCGKGKLYSGFLKLAPRCDQCGLDYKFVDSGDGPAIFVMLIAGFIVAGAALSVEVLYEPPMWVHAAILLPLTLVVCLGLLRPLKSGLIFLQYRNRAEEGRLEP